MSTNDAPPPMSEESRCPQCGAVLPPNAPAGLCPACLLRQGVTADSISAAQPLGFEPPSVAELAPLFPQLEILEFIGKGGMGAVYKARQKDLDRIVALKILPPTLGEAPAFAERFAREAKALAKLNHPGIVTIHDFGRADGLYFFLMEYVDGVNLRQLLAGGRISPREALAIVPEICDALQFAHDHGIVHRDIKPANILIDRRGRVKVADFGLAKLIEAGAEAAAAENGGEAGAAAGSTLTEAGNVMGTPSYMAPEQTERPDEVDHRADIYSLGVVLYELLTGELPTSKLQPPSRKVHIDVRLDEMVLRALERQPELRYQQASEMKTQVEAINATPQTAASASSAPPHLRPPQDALTESRFSRKAIIGATWSALFFIAIVPALFVTSVTVTSTGQPPPGPAWWQLLLGFTLLPLGLTSPFGTTILGVIALSQIRRSQGRIHGLGLAVFDAVLFPLLALDVLIIFCGVLPYQAIHTVLRNTWASEYHDAIRLITILLVVLTCAAVDYLIIRMVWRAVNPPRLVPPTSKRSNPQHTYRKWQFAGTLGALVLILFAVVVFLSSHFNQPSIVVSAQRDTPAIAHLPQGSIELVGVSYHPSKDQLWWRPDGTPIGKGAFVTQGNDSNATEDEQVREFVLRVKDLPEDASALTWKLEPSVKWVGGQGWTANQQETPELERIAATLPKSAKKISIKASVAMGPWDTLAETAAGLTSIQRPKRHGTTHTVSFTEAVESEGRTTITVAHTVQNQDVRIVAIDLDGKEHANFGFKSTGSNQFTQLMATFNELPLARVKAFRFQVRPYQLVEFRNVALNPNLEAARWVSAK